MQKSLCRQFGFTNEFNTHLIDVMMGIYSNRVDNGLTPSFIFVKVWTKIKQYPLYTNLWK